MIRESLPVKLLLRASSWLGLPRWTSRRGAPGLRVLMYHGVSADDRFDGVTNALGYTVSRRRFEEQIAYLARRCRIVSLDDVLEGRLNGRCTNVLLSFDDGYENNYTEAFPVLERHGASALFALPTAFVCERRPLWNDVIEAAVERTGRRAVSLPSDAGERSFELDPSGRLELLRWLMRRAVEIEPVRRDPFIAEVAARLEVDVEGQTLFATADYRPLEPDQVRAMVASGRAEFASHSISHFMMAGLDAPERCRELEESKAAVEALTGVDCRAFCVPGGSYDADLVSQARRLGFAAVLTSDPGWADPDAPTWNRCGIFATYDRHRFADEVHGPVIRALVGLRTLLRGA